MPDARIYTECIQKRMWVGIKLGSLSLADTKDMRSGRLAQCAGDAIQITN